MDKFDKSIVAESTGMNGYPLSAWHRLLEMGNKPQQAAQDAYAYYKQIGQQAIQPAQALELMSPDLRQGVPAEAMSGATDPESELFRKRQALQGLLGNGQ